MLDSFYVEVAAALAVVFFVLASMVAALNQWLTRLLSIRAKILWRALANALDENQGTELDLTLPMLLRQAVSSTAPKVGAGAGATLSAEVANAATVRTLSGPPRGDGKTRVDYIPSKIFASTLVALSAGGADPTLAALKTKTAGTVVGDVVSVIADNAQDGLDQASAAIEEWFNGYMDRLSELYRVSARKILFIAGFGIAIVLNISALGLIDDFSQNSNARAALTGAIDLCAETDTPETCSGSIIQQLEQSDEAVSLPIVGTYHAPWSELGDADGIGGWVQVLLGWLATGVAVSFGAPFWFDVARRLSSLSKR